MAQKQMGEIAKALTFHSRILILDEPTASLTQQEVDALFGIIRELKAEGVSIVLHQPPAGGDLSSSATG
jgi:ABC-type sugar transport system ATPase subunit